MVVRQDLSGPSTDEEEKFHILERDRLHDKRDGINPCKVRLKRSFIKYFKSHETCKGLYVLHRLDVELDSLCSDTV